MPTSILETNFVCVFCLVCLAAMVHVRMCDRHFINTQCRVDWCNDTYLVYTDGLSREMRAPYEGKCPTHVDCWYYDILFVYESGYGHRPKHIWTTLGLFICSWTYGNICYMI